MCNETLREVSCRARTVLALLMRHGFERVPTATVRGPRLVVIKLQIKGRKRLGFLRATKISWKLWCSCGTKAACMP